MNGEMKNQTQNGQKEKSRMTENLAEMINNVPDTTTEQNKNEVVAEAKPEAKKKETKKVEEISKKKEEPLPEGSFKIISLFDFFKKNQTFFTEPESPVRYVNISTVKGVDSQQTLAFSVLDPKVKSDDATKNRHLISFNDVHQRAILDMEPAYMNIFRNGIVVTYKPEKDIIVKCYSVTSSLYVILSATVKDKVIPYQVSHLKRKEKVVALDQEMAKAFVEDISKKLEKDIDKELLIMTYKQFDKYKDQVTNLETGVDWLLKRQVGITDVNHLLQLDNAIITVCKNSK